MCCVAVCESGISVGVFDVVGCSLGLVFSGVSFSFWRFLLSGWTCEVRGWYSVRVRCFRCISVSVSVFASGRRSILVRVVWWLWRFV